MKKQPLIAIGVFVLLLGLYFATREKQVSVGVKKLEVAGLDKAKVKSLEVSGPMSATLQKEGDKWMVLDAKTKKPHRVEQGQIDSALNLVVHVRRFEDGVRRVETISEVVGLEGPTPLMNTIFQFKRQGREGRNVTGTFSATGVVPRVAELLRERGEKVPPQLFMAQG